MSKMTKLLLLVGLITISASVQAGISLDISVSPNSQGNDIYIFTASSDIEPISSVGFYVYGDGNLGQVHPVGVDTHLQDMNPFIIAIGAQVDQDTQAMFATAADTLLTVATTSDTADLMEVYFTGFTPFQSRDILQVVSLGGSFDWIIGIVAGGVEYEFVSPEPASLSMLAIASLVLIRRP